MSDSSLHELILELKLLDARFKQALVSDTKNVQAFEQQLKKTEETARKFKSLAISGAVFSGMGYGIIEVLKGMAEPAVAFHKAQTDLAIATGASSEQLKAFADQAHHLSDILPSSAEEIAQAQTTLAQTLGSVQAAYTSVDTVAQFAAATNMTAAESAELLSSAYETVGDRTKPVVVGIREIADVMATLVTKFPHSQASNEEMTRSFAHAAVAARVYGLSLKQLGATLAVVQTAGYGGGRGAGTYVEELITAMGRLKSGRPAMSQYVPGAYAVNAQGGLDLLRTIQNLRRMPLPNLKAYEKSLGTEGQLLQTLIDHYQDLKADTAAFGDSTGASGRAAASAMKDWSNQFKVFSHIIENLKEALGTALVPALTAAMKALAPLARAFAWFAESSIGKYIVGIGLALSGLAAAALLLIGPMLMTIAIFKEFEMWQTLLTLGTKAFVGVFRGLVYVFSGSAIADIAKGAKLIRTAMIGLDLAFLANPITWIVAGAVALAAIGYEVWKHWDKVKEVFEGAYEWGVHLIENLVKGIEDGLGKVHKAMQHVAKTIKSYLPFSPAEAGPLRDIQRVRIVQSIVETLKPAPLAAAMRSIALAAAVTPLFVQPVQQLRAATQNTVQPLRSGASTASIPVTMNITMNLTGMPQPQSVIDELKREFFSRRYEIAALVHDAMSVQVQNWERTRF